MKINSLTGVFLFLNLLTAWSMKVELIETSLKSPGTLQRNETLYVLIRYESEQTLRFQAIGTYQNHAVDNNASLNPSPPYPAGKGEAIAWVAYSEATRIDGLEVSIYNNRWRFLEKVSLPLSVQWTNTNDGVAQHLPAWVQKLNQ